MAIEGYSQIITVDAASSLPSVPVTGMSPFAYAQDTMRHYMFSNGTWVLVTNLSDGAKAWVSGVQKTGSYVYYSKSTTVSGTITFYITDDGTSTGNAIFNNVYADTITVSPYGSSAVYQISAPTVAANKKSITATVNQITSVVLGLIQVTSAANGVQCNMLVMGD